MIKQIENEADFAPEVLEESGTVVADFWSMRCAPCRMMLPVLEELEQAYPDVKIVKADVDSMPKTARRYGIDSIPAFLMFRDGILHNHAVGAMPMRELAKQLGL